MKIIIFGLGNFGSTLAIQLTSMGHEVIGIDKDKHKADQHAENITYTMSFDSTDKAAISSLPLHDVDIVVVAIGEDFGSSLLTSALLKEMKVKRLYCRAITDLHKEILNSIGVTEILFPEKMSAEHFANTMIHSKVLDYYSFTETIEIIRILVPSRFLGLRLQTIGFSANFQLQVLSILKSKYKKGIFGNAKASLSEITTPEEYELNENDQLILMGSKKAIASFIKDEL